MSENLQIIDPIPVKRIKKELTQEHLLCPTNKGGNELYVINIHDCPFTMQEIGRLREITFRKAGGGTGKELDVDHYDDFFDQLVLWSPKEEKIIGGYRFICMNELHNHKELQSPTGEIFHLSNKFKEEYLPWTIELGRSFIIPEYQHKANRAAIFSLDNLWDGLGALVVKFPDMKHFFGKVTLYPSFNPMARSYILYFLRKHFPDREKLAHPIYPIPGIEEEILAVEKQVQLLEQFMKGSTYQDDFKHLLQAVAALGEEVPPLVKQYMDLAATTKTFGISISPSFGNVHEIGILVTIDDIHDEKKRRHIESYEKYLSTRK